MHEHTVQTGAPFQGDGGNLVKVHVKQQMRCIRLLAALSIETRQGEKNYVPEKRGSPKGFLTNDASPSVDHCRVRSYEDSGCSR